MERTIGQNTVLCCVLFLTVLCKFLTNEENGWSFRTKSHCAALRIILNSFRQICDQQGNCMELQDNWPKSFSVLRIILNNALFTFAVVL
jgi:hypothetical protein